MATVAEELGNEDEEDAARSRTRAALSKLGDARRARAAAAATATGDDESDGSEPAAAPAMRVLDGRKRLRKLSDI